jgi:hypothetical protein
MSRTSMELDRPLDCPAAEIANALVAAREEPNAQVVDADSILADLGLDGSLPDGRSFYDRFTAGETGDRATLAAMYLVQLTAGLIEATHKRTANPAETAIAKALGAAVAAHVTREGRICPRAQIMALAAPDDIISPELKSILPGIPTDLVPSER